MRSKTRWLIAGVVFAAVLCLATVGVWRVLTTPPVREIPPGQAKRLFQWVTAYSLPESVEDLRSVFWDSRDPMIFVRFKTNAEGIAYVTRVFGGPYAQSWMLDADEWRRTEGDRWRPFYQLENAEKKWGVPHLFDMGSLKSALCLSRTVWSERNSYLGDRQYDILIDTENSIVYMQAMYNR